MSFNVMFRIALIVSGFVLAAGVLGAEASESGDQAILDPGGFDVVAAAGPVLLDRQATWGLEASIRAGIAEGVEIASPLAIGIRLIDAGHGSAIYAGVGVVDLWVTGDGRLLTFPLAALAAKARFGPEAALFAAADLAGVEQNMAEGEHPAWARGAAALAVDMGPWVTVSVGAAYQRLVIGRGAPDGAERTGWTGDARFSVGAVRSRPFSELPTLSVHVAENFDVVAFLRLDVDTDKGTTDSWWLFGAEGRWPFKRSLER